jgi:hypothetical protein
LNLLFLGDLGVRLVAPGLGRGSPLARLGQFLLHVVERLLGGLPLLHQLELGVLQLGLAAVEVASSCCRPSISRSAPPR